MYWIFQKPEPLLVWGVKYFSFMRYIGKKWHKMVLWGSVAVWHIPQDSVAAAGLHPWASFPQWLQHLGMRFITEVEMKCKKMFKIYPFKCRKLEQTRQPGVRTAGKLRFLWCFCCGLKAVCLDLSTSGTKVWLCKAPSSSVNWGLNYSWFVFKTHWCVSLGACHIIQKIKI